MLVLLASITYSTLLIVAFVLAGFVAPISAPFGRLARSRAWLCSHFYLTHLTASKWQSLVPWTFPATGLCKCFPLLVAQLLGLWFVLEFVSEMWERRKQRLAQETPQDARRHL